MRVRASKACLSVLTLSACALFGVTAQAAVPAPGTVHATNAVSSVPRPDHVVMLLMENHSETDIVGNPDAPYLNSLASTGASMTQSFAITHPSQPNYIALFSGSTAGITDDSCPHTLTAPNLGAELITAGLGFATYSEDLPSVGYQGCAAGNYARKHNPASNFPSVPSSANQPLTAFPTDFTTLPAVSYVVPNLQHDMHDGTVGQADSWVQSTLGSYLTWAKTHRSILVVTWDEDDNGSANQIPTFIVGGGVARGQYPEHITHYNVLRTLQDAYGLAPTGASATAAPILDIWSPPAAPEVTAADSFNRTVTGGWGNADTGGGWSLSGSASRFSVTPGAAAMTLGTAGSSLGAGLNSVSSSDTDLRLSVSPDKIATNNGIYLGLVGRHVSTNTEYQGRVRIRGDGAVLISFVALEGSSSLVTVKSEVVASGITLAAGATLRTRLQVVGVNSTALRLKVWLSTAGEPTGWQLSASDATAALQAAGSIGVTGYLSSTSTIAPLTMRFSALTAAPTATSG